MNAYSEILKQHKKTQSYENKISILVNKVDIPIEEGWYFCIQPFQKQIYYIKKTPFGLLAITNGESDMSISDTGYFPPELTEWHGPIPFPKRTILA